MANITICLKFSCHGRTFRIDSSVNGGNYTYELFETTTGTETKLLTIMRDHGHVQHLIEQDAFITRDVRRIAISICHQIGGGANIDQQVTEDDVPHLQQDEDIDPSEPPINPDVVEEL